MLSRPFSSAATATNRSLCLSARSAKLPNLQNPPPAAPMTHANKKNYRSALTDRRRASKVGEKRPLELEAFEVTRSSLLWNSSMIELPEVVEDGMSGRNGQRKPGTARGSPRRSCTAKASRISRCAVKSRCACERGGWGRLSDDGPGQYNPDRSENRWGRWSTPPHGSALSSPRPGSVRGNRCWSRGARRAKTNRTKLSVCREQT